MIVMMRKEWYMEYWVTWIEDIAVDSTSVAVDIKEKDSEWISISIWYHDGAYGDVHV